MNAERRAVAEQRPAIARGDALLVERMTGLVRRAEEAARTVSFGTILVVIRTSSGPMPVAKGCTDLSWRPRVQSNPNAVIDLLAERPQLAFGIRHAQEAVVHLRPIGDGPDQLHLARSDDREQRLDVRGRDPRLELVEQRVVGVLAARERR